MYSSQTKQNYQYNSNNAHEIKDTCSSNNGLFDNVDSASVYVGANASGGNGDNSGGDSGYNVDTYQMLKSINSAYNNCIGADELGLDTGLNEMLISPKTKYIGNDNDNKTYTILKKNTESIISTETLDTIDTRDDQQHKLINTIKDNNKINIVEKNSNRNNQFKNIQKTPIFDHLSLSLYAHKHRQFDHSNHHDHRRYIRKDKYPNSSRIEVSTKSEINKKSRKGDNDNEGDDNNNNNNQDDDMSLRSHTQVNISILDLNDYNDDVNDNENIMKKSKSFNNMNESLMLSGYDDNFNESSSYLINTITNRYALNPYYYYGNEKLIHTTNHHNTNNNNYSDNTYDTIKHMKIHGGITMGLDQDMFVNNNDIHNVKKKNINMNNDQNSNPIWLINQKYQNIPNEKTANIPKNKLELYFNKMNNNITSKDLNLLNTKNIHESQNSSRISDNSRISPNYHKFNSKIQHIVPSPKAMFYENEINCNMDLHNDNSKSKLYNFLMMNNSSYSPNMNDQQISKNNNNTKTNGNSKFYKDVAVYNEYSNMKIKNIKNEDSITMRMTTGMGMSTSSLINRANSSNKIMKNIYDIESRDHIKNSHEFIFGRPNYLIAKKSIPIISMNKFVGNDEISTKNRTNIQNINKIIGIKGNEGTQTSNAYNPSKIKMKNFIVQPFKHSGLVHQNKKKPTPAESIFNMESEYSNTLKIPMKISQLKTNINDNSGKIPQRLIGQITGDSTYSPRYLNSQVKANNTKTTKAISYKKHNLKLDMETKILTSDSKGIFKEISENSKTLHTINPETLIETNEICSIPITSKTSRNATNNIQINQVNVTNSPQHKNSPMASSTKSIKYPISRNLGNCGNDGIKLHDHVDKKEKKYFMLPLVSMPMKVGDSVMNFQDHTNHD